MSHPLRDYGTGHDNTGKIVSKQQINGLKFTKKDEEANGSILEPN